MKYVVLVGDGMGDYPLEKLQGQTPLAAAATPHMDALARQSWMGLTQTIPPDRAPGSDTANLALMGINPSSCLCGRGPMEAAAMNIELAPDDIAFRCNLVQLVFQADGGVIMDDYAAGHITSAESHALIAALQQELNSDNMQFYPGVSFRHVLVWKGAPYQAPTIPPHDRSGKPVNDALRPDPELGQIADIIRKSWPILRNHPVNADRRQRGKAAANSIWLWGQSRRPDFPTIKQRFGLNGVVITAVDLVKGLGKMVGLDIVNVAGATGYLDTNYQGKVEAALKALSAGADLAFVHVEAPDEASHEGKLELKLKAIADFDALVVGPLLENLRKLGPVRVLLATDHFTPLSIRTHARDPIPFAIWDSGNPRSGGKGGYNEAAATATGILLPHAWDLLRRLISPAR
jgi:2,3-bisphosphoglycerate-independent phosphoglycerate mutase